MHNFNEVQSQKILRGVIIYINFVSQSVLPIPMQSLQLSLVKQALAAKVLCISSFFYEAVMQWKQGAKEFSEQKLFTYLKVEIHMCSKVLYIKKIALSYLCLGRH